MKELIIKLAAIMGLAAKPEGEEYTEQEIQDAISASLSDRNNVRTRVTELEGELATLTPIKQKFEDLQVLSASAVSLKVFEEARTKELRDNASRNYKLAFGEKVDPTVLSMIEKANYETLNLLNTQYEALAEDKMPLTCGKCGSQSVSRKSSKSFSETGGSEADSVQDAINKKSKQGSFQLYGNKKA